VRPAPVGAARPEIAVAGTASQRLLANQPHRVALNASRLAPHLFFAAMNGLQTAEFHGCADYSTFTLRGSTISKPVLNSSNRPNNSRNLV
jgi:hypothetical protein